MLVVKKTRMAKREARPGEKAMMNGGLGGQVEGKSEVKGDERLLMSFEVNVRASIKDRGMMMNEDKRKKMGRVWQMMRGRCCQDV